MVPRLVRSIEAAPRASEVVNTRKIIQISTSADDNGKPTIHALCDDGSLWVSGVPGYWIPIDTSGIENAKVTGQRS
jgi:hypothetical protein